MITRMEIVSAQAGAPELPLGGFMPNSDPVQIRNIEGLGPVKAEVSATPFATGRGELYQGVSTGKRNIVLTLGLNPNWIDQTMSSLRQILYRYFMPERWSKLLFFSDELPVAQIGGVVESFEPNIFSQDPEIQISILCPKPDFIDVDTTLLSGTTRGSFGIPEGSPPGAVIDYIGTVPTGFDLRIHTVSGSYSGGVYVNNEIGGEVQEFYLENVTISSGMYLQLNTVRSTRHIYSVVVAGNVEYDILAKMGKESDWPEFSPGENGFTVMTDDSGLIWELAYFNRFGGL